MSFHSSDSLSTHLSIRSTFVSYGVHTFVCSTSFIEFCVRVMSLLPLEGFSLTFDQILISVRRFTEPMTQ